MNKIDQRIDGLYQNWQAEYKEAITSEQCEDIQKFYEPYVRKYETKYKVLYQMLRQAIDERNRVPSSRVSATALTPRLVALEDASTLKRKEWNRGEPDIETSHMYSTIDGRLTPTAACIQRYENQNPFECDSRRITGRFVSCCEEVQKIVEQPNDLQTMQKDW